LKDQIPAKQAALKKLKADYGHRSLGEVTVEQVCFPDDQTPQSIFSLL
jgi:hypothetical protein